MRGPQLRLLGKVTADGAAQTPSPLETSSTSPHPLRCQSWTGKASRWAQARTAANPSVAGSAPAALRSFPGHCRPAPGPEQVFALALTPPARLQGTSLLSISEFTASAYMPAKPITGFIHLGLVGPKCTIMINHPPRAEPGTGGPGSPAAALAPAPQGREKLLGAV